MSTLLTPAGYFGICRSALQLIKLNGLLVGVAAALVITEAQLIACSIEAQDGSIARDDHTIGHAERDGVDRVGSSIRELQRILTVGSVNILAVDLERVAVVVFSIVTATASSSVLEVILLLAIVAET